MMIIMSVTVVAVVVAVLVVKVARILRKKLKILRNSQILHTIFVNSADNFSTLKLSLALLYDPVCHTSIPA